MDDKQLLEAAARAAGFNPIRWGDDYPGGWLLEGEQESWNPLTDDGDALRLAVKLELTVLPGLARDGEGRLSSESGDDPYAATRRAIVRAAASLAPQGVARCKCGEKSATDCDEEWGPNCDLGNNPAHARRAPAGSAEAVDAALGITRAAAPAQGQQGE